MASCKDIKKDINFLANQILIECFSYMEYSPVNNQENVLDILHDVEQLRRNLLIKVNNPPQGVKIKEYFRNIITEMYDMNMKLLEELNSLSEK
ncbi:MAG: hypothetical protein PF485_04545 [Bacteroidales bacterium]|jgi:predicted RNA methylase|nr:hypothetical protein [Bacteroidales bacterium]